jgi:hypothetical protein
MGDHLNPPHTSRGEISPLCAGGPWRAEVFSRKQRLATDARLLLVVRASMESLRSHFQMACWDFVGVDDDFDACGADSSSRVAISRSDYGSQIQCMLDFFKLVLDGC